MGSVRLGKEKVIDKKPPKEVALALAVFPGSEKLAIGKLSTGWGTVLGRL